jgi:hypothetical protein
LRRASSHRENTRGATCSLKNKQIRFLYVLLLKKWSRTRGDGKNLVEEGIKSDSAHAVFQLLLCHQLKLDAGARLRNEQGNRFFKSLYHHQSGTAIAVELQNFTILQTVIMPDKDKE